MSEVSSDRFQVSGEREARDSLCEEISQNLNENLTEHEVVTETVIYNDSLSCVQWCKYARKCVGDEMYEHLMEIVRRKKEREEGSGTADNRLM